MVCPRCIRAVEEELKRLNIGFSEVTLGKVSLTGPLNESTSKEFKDSLEAMGFELLTDKKTIIIEKVKTYIIDTVHHQNDPDKIGHLADRLSRHIGMDYSSLSKLFSKEERITIEKFMIFMKIEKAKELITYNELTVSEIALQLNYSNSQHFSNQFKSVTGLSPTQYKKDKSSPRKPLNEV
jgi:AraC-like DNA-binding protein